jgi:hypothetical protein
MKIFSQPPAILSLLLLILLYPAGGNAQTKSSASLHAQVHLDALDYLSSNASLTGGQMEMARETMLAINNEARMNPNYRVAQGCTTALQVPTNLEPLSLNEDLNKLAQEQADYQASVKEVTHDNRNYRDFGARVDRYLKNHPKPEACGGSTNLADYPIGWMKSETHYRPTWNLNGDNSPTAPMNAVGYGIAKNGDMWYLTAIWSFVADPEAIKKANKDNIAFGKSARQSSDLDARYAGAGKAVDGNIDANLKMNDAKSSVSHTQGEASPWWEVDLGAVYDIGKVVIWNRKDCCWDRLQGFVVSTSETPFNSQQAGSQLGPFSPWSAQEMNHTVDVNKKGRYVRVSLPTDTRNPRRELSLTEVQVFGKAADPSSAPTSVAANTAPSSTPAPKAVPDPFAAKATTVATQKYQTTMKPGDKLLEGEKVVSANGRYQLRGTRGGDFVIEEVQIGRVVYTFPLGSPFGERPAKSILSYNPDGNICIQSTQNKSYCATNGRDAVAPLILNKSHHAELTDDGRFILVDTKGEEVWASAPKAQATATGGRIRFRNKNKDEGLAYSHVDKVFALGNTVYAATAKGLCISTDGGNSFTTALESQDWVRGAYASGNTVYAATDGGLYISTNGGVSFAHRTTAHGLGHNAVSEVYAAGNTIYAATNGGLAVSTDGGNTFVNKTTTNGLGSDKVSVVYALGNTVYAATEGGLGISTDGGNSFMNKTTAHGLGNNLVYGVYAIGNTVYAATKGGGVGISTDGGNTFVNKATATDNWVRRVHAVGNNVYAATDVGLSISTDGGKSFTTYTAADGLGDNAVFGVYAVGNMIYAATAGGVSIGTHGGL